MNQREPHQALAASINGELCDLSTPLKEGDDVHLLDFNSPEGKEVFWHTSAHVLAQAVQLKYPGVQLGFGPPTEFGFYYDFDFGSHSIEESDLKDLEKKMKKIIGQRQLFERVETDYEGALDLLNTHRHEPYKVENLKNLKERGVEAFSFYRNGQFLDVCEGPHIEHTGELPGDAFRLDRVAGAYWLGDEKNKMLTRIYALAFSTKLELDDHLKRRSLAEENDHRKLGKELELYHLEESIGKGLPLWLPNGTIIRDEIEEFARQTEFAHGYQRVCTPHISKGELYERSQHLAAYKDSMFPPMRLEEEGGKSIDYYLKPMNCPHHHMIFKYRKRSYKELPLRLAEYGTCYRYEQSGELSGLIRVRAMTMNDAHIYLRESQFEEECKNIMKMYLQFYETFRLREFSFRLSVRGEDNKDKFKGDPAMWDKAEYLLEKVLKEMGQPFDTGIGEAAFYGPKIDIQFRNLMGREETVSTIQVDFLSPINFDLTFINEQSQEEKPIIIHRAPLSTHERFLSFLVEYYGGAFPTWCAPVQVCLVPVNESCHEYCKELAAVLHKNRIRCTFDDSQVSFNKKIRNNTVKKVPIIVIVGQKEVDNNEVTVRRYGIKEQATLTRKDFMQSLFDEIYDRKMYREPISSLF